MSVKIISADFEYISEIRAKYVCGRNRNRLQEENKMSNQNNQNQQNESQQKQNEQNQQNKR